MKKFSGKALLKWIKEYLVVTCAGMFNAMSLYCFVNPSKLIAGGFSGLASALTYVVNLFVPQMEYDNLMTIVYITINVPLLICSLIFLRGDFTFKTIWATLTCTVTLDILSKYFPYLKFTDHPFIAVVFGGVMIGFAMYIASENNGSNGGTEIIAKLVAKYRPEIDLSNVVLAANFFINVCGSIIVIVIEHEGASVIVYSMLFIFIGSTVFGIFKRGFNHPQKFMIVTTEYETLANDITTYFKRGCTCVDVVNFDENAPTRKIVMVIVQYRQMPRLKQLIKLRDPNAFTFVKDVHDVFSRPTFNRSYKLK